MIGNIAIILCFSGALIHLSNGSYGYAIMMGVLGTINAIIHEKDMHR